jgi:hypothetical protein
MKMQRSPESKTKPGLPLGFERADIVSVRGRKIANISRETEKILCYDAFLLDLQEHL